MKTKFIIALFLLSSSFSFAQLTPSNVTALWSQTGLWGTARTMGSGGAYGSVGADMGCISINPAGLGIYRSTDFSVTPLLQFGANQALYDNNNTFAHKTSFALLQGGFVYTKLFKKQTENKGMDFSDHPVRSLSFALNFQQQAVFDHNEQYAATNTSQSLIDGFVSNLNSGNIGIYSAPEVYMASAANLFGQNPNGTYYSNVKAPVDQSGSIETSGGINRIDAALGLNFLDKLYFGFDLAVPILGYNLSNTFTEAPTNVNSNGIEDYTMNAVTSESGFGFNGIVGLIYRPLPWMRLGAAYHLPTWYNIHENYVLNYNEDTSVYNYNTNSPGNSPLTVPAFLYDLRTPMKGTFSASFYYKEFGFISVDYEIQNLGASRIHVPNDSTQFEPYYNQVIESTYKLNHTIHAGLEGVIKVVRLRAGYFFSTSPYKSGQEFTTYGTQPITTGYNGVRNAITAGIGVRLTHFYADLAYVYGWSKDATYQLSNLLPVNSTSTYSTLVLTLGWRFDAGAKNNSQKKATRQPQYTPPPVDDQRY